MGWRDTLVSTGDEGGGGNEKPRRPGR
jgi:hypothetical protein